MLRNLKSHIAFCIIALLCGGQWVSAQDSVKTTLRTVSISSNRPPSTTNVTPTQVVTHKELERQGAITVGDAVKNMAGLTLKDYGGVGGMKTVSIRGLGSQFSALTIDGVSVNDAQNGQIDLGRYLLGGVSHVSLSQGQEENTMQPARSYASGSVINIESLRPQFYGRKYNLKMSLEGGSFGLLSPTLSWEQRLGRRWALTLYGNLLKSDGDYPFTLYYGNSSTDSSSTEKRSNSQVHQGTVDANLYGDMGDGRTFTGKLHLIGGYHALPGPVTYYSTKGSEHSEELMCFAQGRYKHVINEKWKYQVVGKYKYAQDIYEDTASHLTVSGLLRNEYVQQEGYFSTALNYSPTTALRFFLSNDVAQNQLESNLAHFNHVVQWSDYTVVGARLHPIKDNNHLDYLEGHILHTWSQDVAQTRQSEEERIRVYQQLSPYLGLQITPWTKSSFKVRYFFKETFRTPSFSENFYFTMTRDLQPEKAIQNNLGITCLIPHSNSNSDSTDNPTKLIVDGYYNRVSNKIIAVPTQNMFLWSMMNLGRVDILGLDFQIEKLFDLGLLELLANINYSYQHAVDKTDPSSKTYNNQIPYTPRHSGTLTLGAQLEWFEANFTASLVGKRYSMQQNTPYCELEPYADLGFSMSREFHLKHSNITASARVLNLLNTQYEIVKSYPMMGRNYRLGIIVKI